MIEWILALLCSAISLHTCFQFTYCLFSTKTILFTISSCCVSIELLLNFTGSPITLTSKVFWVDLQNHMVSLAPKRWSVQQQPYIHKSQSTTTHVSYWNSGDKKPLRLPITSRRTGWSPIKDAGAARKPMSPLLRSRTYITTVRCRCDRKVGLVFIVFRKKCRQLSYKV